MFTQYFFLCCLAILFYEVAGEYGCPDPEEIKPCSCEEYAYVDLKCEKINNVDTLIDVFKKAERYHFNKFTLKNSTLQFIPHDLFENVKIHWLDFDTVTFMNTFDAIPTNPGVKKIYIDKVRVMRGWDWEKLSIFNELQDLTIENVPMKKLSTDFRPYISKSLQVLRFNWCQMKRLRDDEFAEFNKLKVFTAVHDEITTIKRSMFSRPSNLEEISFEYNKISIIPDDMFEDMPKLNYVAFGNNQIAVLPEKAFKPVYDHLLYLRVHDNKLKCDCLIYWLVYHKPQYLTGSCLSPRKLHGVMLENLKADQFRCTGAMELE